MSDFFTLAIGGAAISLLVQWLKKYTLGGWRVQVLLLVLSLVGGGVYLFFQAHTNYWLEVVKVVVAANAVYSFILKYLEKPASPNPPTGV